MLQYTKQYAIQNLKFRTNVGQSLLSLVELHI